MVFNTIIIIIIIIIIRVSANLAIAVESNFSKSRFKLLIVLSSFYCSTNHT